MKRSLLRLVCIAGAIFLALGMAGFWYLKVTPVTVINLSHSTLHDVQIDLQGRKLDIGTLEHLDARKVYGIPGPGSMIAISLVFPEGARHREIEYMEGNEGTPQIVLIYSPQNIIAISVPGALLK